MEHVEVFDQHVELVWPQVHHLFGRGEEIGVDGVEFDVEVVDKAVAQEEQVGVEFVAVPVDGLEYAVGRHERNRTRVNLEGVEVDGNFYGALHAYYDDEAVEAAGGGGVEIGCVGSDVGQDVVLAEMRVVVAHVLELCDLREAQRFVLEFDFLLHREWLADLGIYRPYRAKFPFYANTASNLRLFSHFANPFVPILLVKLFLDSSGNFYNGKGTFSIRTP